MRQISPDSHLSEGSPPKIDLYILGPKASCDFRNTGLCVGRGREEPPYCQQQAERSWRNQILQTLLEKKGHDISKMRQKNGRNTDLFLIISVDIRQRMTKSRYEVSQNSVSQEAVSQLSNRNFKLTLHKLNS